jgi:hypothetical protein
VAASRQSYLKVQVDLLFGWQHLLDRTVSLARYARNHVLLDDPSSSANDTGQSVLGTVKRATDTLIAQTETRPLTTLAAVAGIGFLVGLLYRRH